MTTIVNDLNPLGYAYVATSITSQAFKRTKDTITCSRQTPGATRRSTKHTAGMTITITTVHETQRMRRTTTTATRRMARTKTNAMRRTTRASTTNARRGKYGTLQRNTPEEGEGGWKVGKKDDGIDSKSSERTKKDEAEGEQPVRTCCSNGWCIYEKRQGEKRNQLVHSTQPPMIRHKPTHKLCT